MSNEKLLNEIQTELKIIKDAIFVTKEEVRRLGLDQYFKETAFKYSNGILHLFDPYIKEFTPVPMSSQIEHERWQIRMYGHIATDNEVHNG